MFQQKRRGTSNLRGGHARARRSLIGNLPGEPPSIVERVRQPRSSGNSRSPSPPLIYYKSLKLIIKKRLLNIGCIYSCTIRQAIVEDNEGVSGTRFLSKGPRMGFLPPVLRDVAGEKFFTLRTVQASGTNSPSIAPVSGLHWVSAGTCVSSTAKVDKCDERFAGSRFLLSETRRVGCCPVPRFSQQQTIPEILRWYSHSPVVSTRPGAHVCVLAKVNLVGFASHRA